MTTFKELSEGLKALITDKTSTDTAEAIGKLAGKVDELQKQEEDLIAKQEELRQKYIEAVKHNSFGGDNKAKEDEEPKTLEQCLLEASKNGSK